MIEGKRCEYTKNHGFARNLDTKVIFQDKTKVVFELTDSEDTTYRYPYKFSLVTEYELTDKEWYVYHDNYGTTEEKRFVKY